MGRTHHDEPLHIAMKRWPAQEARFQLARPLRRPPLVFGLSLAELREIASLAVEVEVILAEQPHSEGYEMGDLKLMVENRKKRAAA